MEGVVGAEGAMRWGGHADGHRWKQKVLSGTSGHSHRLLALGAEIY